MSAICGSINISDKGLLKGMITTMNYRGNDGTDYLISAEFSFAHGLLKNKLENSPNPIVNEDNWKGSILRTPFHLTNKGSEDIKY